MASAFKICRKMELSTVLISKTSQVKKQVTCFRGASEGEFEQKSREKFFDIVVLLSFGDFNQRGKNY